MSSFRLQASIQKLPKYLLPWAACVNPFNLICNINWILDSAPTLKSTPGSQTQAITIHIYSFCISLNRSKKRAETQPKVCKLPPNSNLFLHDGTLHKLDGFHVSWIFLVLQQQQNLGQRFGTSKMHLSPPVTWAAVPSKAVVLLLLTFCLLLLPLWESVIVLCFVVRYVMSILVLQSSW